MYILGMMGGDSLVVFVEPGGPDGSVAFGGLQDEMVLDFLGLDELCKGVCEGEVGDAYAALGVDDALLGEPDELVGPVEVGGLCGRGWPMDRGASGVGRSG